MATRFPQGPSTSPGFLLWHLTLAWQRAVTAALEPMGLTHVQFVLLASVWWFDEHGEPPNQLDVARQAGTDVKMTSQVLRKLETKALLVREVDPADTRSRRLRLTPAGTALAIRSVTAVEDVDARFFAGDADRLTPLLQRLTAARESAGRAL